MQRNLLYGEKLGNWYSHFSHSMGAFFLSDSHPMVYFIIWEMHGFPSPSISHSTGKCNKTHRLGRIWEIVTHTFPIVWVLFPLDSHSMVYFITWEMYVSSHQFPIAWEKTAKPIEWGKPGKLVPWKILQNPLYGENLENWYSYFYHSIGAFSP